MTREEVRRSVRRILLQLLYLLDRDPLHRVRPNLGRGGVLDSRVDVLQSVHPLVTKLN
jgi:hypothetical protein